MHDTPGKDTDYSKNSMWEMSGAVYDDPLVLRDTDVPTDGTPGPIDCIRTRSVNVKQNWLGEVIHFQNIITQTFDVFFANPSTQKNLQKWIAKLEEFADVGGWKEEIDLYGIKIPHCRIIEISAPTSVDPNQDAIGRGQLNITVEQRVCGDTGTPTGGTTPAPGVAAEPLSSLEGRERKAIPPCYECTLNGTPQGIYVPGAASAKYTSSMGDAQSYAVNKCEGLYSSGQFTTTTSSGGVVPTIGAVQDPECTRYFMSIPGVPGSYTTKDYEGLQNLLKDHCPFIDDIKENFKFDYGKGENISFEHSVSIKLFDSCPKGIDAQIAFDSDPDAHGPGQPGYQGVPVSQEGTAGGEYAGDDGNMSDMLSVCREGQYNVDNALELARKILDTNTPHFGIAFHGGVLRHLDDPKGDGFSGSVPSEYPGGVQPTPGAGDVDRVIPYYSETQNLITGEVTMSKRLTLLKKRDAELNWSADYNHSLSVDTSGIVTVSERGKIRGNKKQPFGAVFPASNTGADKVTDNAYKNSLNGMRELLGADFEEARDRCVDFWEDYRDFYKNSFDGPAAAGSGLPDEPPYTDPANPDNPFALDNIDLKVEHPIEKTRNFNEITRECSYSISFSTSVDIFENFMANRTLTASKGKFGSIVIKEKSELTSYIPQGEDQKRVKADGTIEDCADDPCAAGQPCPDKLVDNPIEIMFPEDYRGKRDPATGVLDATTGAKGRAMAFYNTLLADTIDFKAPNPQGCSQPLKLWSRNINWSPSGRGLTYDVEFTTDKTVSCEYPDPHGIRKTEVSVSDKLPKRMHKEHPIVNNKMMVHDPFQTNLGSRTVKLNVSLERIPKHNMLHCPFLPDVALRELMTRANDEIMNVFADHGTLIADDMRVKSCSYTFNSRWKATVTVAVDYLQKE